MHTHMHTHGCTNRRTDRTYVSVHVYIGTHTHTPAYIPMFVGKQHLDTPHRNPSLRKLCLATREAEDLWHDVAHLNRLRSEGSFWALGGFYSTKMGLYPKP